MLQASVLAGAFQRMRHSALGCLYQGRPVCWSCLMHARTPGAAWAPVSGASSCLSRMVCLCQLLCCAQHNLLHASSQRGDIKTRPSCHLFKKYKGPLRHLSLLKLCTCSAPALRSHSCHWLHEQSCYVDCRFADNKVVTGPPNIVFYAGAPLVSSRGHVIGAL